MNENLIFESNERIKRLREFLDLGRDEFALKLRIKSNQLANIELKKQKTPAWYIETIGKEWPEFSYWIATGLTLPEAGQISPELEEQRRNLQKVG